MHKKRNRQEEAIRVADLFAGVGGFRLGLSSSDGFNVIWSNQWEPGGQSRQFAYRCYERHFRDSGAHFNKDIKLLLDEAEVGITALPSPDVIVGGFPCQDYSVAKGKNLATGIKGKKGVLWWEICRLIRLCAERGEQPAALFLENVDRLLKSPSDQRGRDFAVMLRSLTQLGYEVEWRVVNAADYGFPQRRRRVFIVATLPHLKSVSPLARIRSYGILAKALPCHVNADVRHAVKTFQLPRDLEEVSRSFKGPTTASPFRNAGVVIGDEVTTFDVTPKSHRRKKVLNDVVKRTKVVPAEYRIDEAALEKWRDLKGAKKLERKHRSSGVSYTYAEGAIDFPDPLNRASRTILTSEGGSSPSRTKHVVRFGRGLRRLLPEELERLNGFRTGWTAGMTDNQRAYCMGNALVVGLVRMVSPHLSAAVRAIKSQA